ncbi:hypothetical protein Tco_1189903, partial [Tanacetum coccineum]
MHMTSYDATASSIIVSHIGLANGNCHDTVRSYVAGTTGIRAYTSGTGGNYSGQPRIVKCFNYQGEAQGNGKVIDEEELEFLADPGIAEGPVT